MSSEPTDPTATTTEVPVAEARESLAAADRRLLGDTIAVSDADWRSDTALPGWTRAHVATHLARHADAFSRLTEGLVAGRQESMYPGDRDAEIEAGAGRNGLEIQTDLDTSAGRLAAAFDRLDRAGGWDRPVTLPKGNRLPAGLLPSARLFEVVVHHLDLQLGLEVDDIDDRTAELCLRWVCRRQAGRDDFPALRLQPEGRAPITLGRPSPDTTPVRGRANRLLGWLTGRSGTDGLQDAPADLPGLG